jgi:tetratricopeptide (TPR) repeat protein
MLKILDLIMKVFSFRPKAEDDAQRLRDDLLNQSRALFELRAMEEEVGKLWNEKKFREALVPAKEVNRLTKLLLGEISRAYGQSIYNFGRIHRLSGSHKDALKYFEEALEIQKKVHGSRSEEVRLTLESIKEVKSQFGTM